MVDIPHIVRIHSAPGIKRDGTMLEGDAHVDGRWVRWQRGIARKIFGYRAVDKYLGSLPRALNLYVQNALGYLHAGSATKVERMTVSSDLVTSVISDRTPGSLVADPNNLWQFDVIRSLNDGLQLVAQVAPSLSDISSSTDGQLFVGDLTGTSALTAVTTLPGTLNRSGGIFALHPYTVAFGSDGFIMWSVPGDPTDYTSSGAGFAYVTGQKIVRGLPIRGGGSSPSGLLWSLDSLLRMTYIGGTPVFQFDTLATEISIISPRSAIDYDGVFYWIGSDRFLVYNGVVRELPNTMNANFFFDNVNRAHAQKIFAFKVPRFGEIWWCFPFGTSTEPDHAIIYNVRENAWYDTPLPNGGRGAGVSPINFRYPILTGVAPSSGSYKLWVHEKDLDEIDGLTSNPIESFYETGDYTLPIELSLNKSICIELMEPDFVQSGEMTMQIKGRANARSPEVSGDPVAFPDTATTVAEQVLNLKAQRRQIRFRFTSNTVGGNFEEGVVLAHIKPGDGTVRG